jgi:hypothetical protein
MTLDAEAQGLDTVHESQKSFFDYEMERMRELIKKIGELVANGLESMMKSLYMNEYIVSAFKNATHGKLEREYDIGWDRPLETTAFKKGEVEYIIFGKMNEAENIAASQRSIFAIRLIFIFSTSTPIQKRSQQRLNRYCYRGMDYIRRTPSAELPDGLLGRP